MNIETKEVIETKKRIMLLIDGNVYDAQDMYNLVHDLKEDTGIFITDKKVVNLLLSENIISDPGNNYTSASVGPNFATFFTNIDRIGKEYNF
jgi:hypothetical protein